MDGVLANFAYKFKEVAGLEPKEYIQAFGQDAFWKECDSVRFWSEMPMERNAPMLWQYLSNKGVTLLTTPSPQATSRVGKILWKAKLLKGNPKIIFSHSKEDYADSRSILIDDYKENLNKWESAGGIGIRCRNGNVSEVIKQIESIINN
jgi:hypothetical protein